MAVDAGVIPKIKEAHFRVNVAGFEQSLCEQFNPGDREHMIVEHHTGTQRHPSKETGNLKFTNATIRHVVPVTGADRDFWEKKAEAAVNAETSIGGLPVDYLFDFSVTIMKPNQEPSIIWEFYNAQVARLKPGNMDAASDKNLIEEVEIAYEWRRKRTM